MSLNVLPDEARNPVRITFRTIDQYSVWRARVHNYCWATTRRDVFSVTDDQRVEATNAFEKGESKHDWVGKAWITINSSLHDDLFMKVCHIEQGHLASLLGRDSLRPARQHSRGYTAATL